MTARPRCGKPMLAYQLNRPRDYDPAPVCGLPAGHSGQCVTAESYQRSLRRHAEHEARLRREKEKEA